MALRLVRGHRWPDLLDRLAAELAESRHDPFAWSRVIVSSRATGRIISQEVAARLGISAGISYVTPAQLVGRLADDAGVARDRSRWLGVPLEMAIWQAMDSVAATHPLLARATDESRAGGRRATAQRLAQLMRWYVDTAPDLVAAWLDGDDVDLGGEALPARSAWQPSLLRAAVDALEVDPLDTTSVLIQAASTDETPTFVFCVDELTVPQRLVIEALPSRVVLAPIDSPCAEWAQGLTDSVQELPSPPLPVPAVTVHDSHGPARQVEVLRDELTRAFAADPTLEPRDAVIICPRPARYAQLLDAAFSESDEAAHPGRTLRLQHVSAQPANPVITLLSTLLRLGELRASATGLVDLMLSGPIAHRWRLRDRQQIIELVGGAGVRWGMDATHRAAFNLEGLAQNTWMRGLDRLLIGLAVAPGHDGGLQLAGTDVVASSDLETIGSLCEIVSRLRRLVADTSVPRTVPGWVEVSRSVLSDLVGVARDDEWQILQTHALLARLESDLAGNETLLTRRDFSHLLAGAAGSPRERVAAGNGSLLVAPLGELRHVEHRLVAFLGVTDDVVPGPSAAMPDSIDLGSAAPDRRSARLAHLLGHARSAERVLIVEQASSQRTNRPVPTPSAISWLLEELDVTVAPVTHPPTATSERNFTADPSFDAAAHAGAVARRSAAPIGTTTQRRRHQARTRPLGPVPRQVSLQQLGRFLTDPAKAFLRSAANLALFAEPELSDDIPLELKGLSQWSVVSTLVDALKQERPIDDVIRRLRSDEELPPGEIGRAEFERARRQAELLWGAAGPAWQADIRDVAVDLTVDVPGLGVVRLVDEVRCRGGVAVEVSAGKRLDRLIAPWLGSLALTACGSPTKGRLYRLVQDPTDFSAMIPDVREVGEPTPAGAHARLAVALKAYCLGQHRLIPAPADAAIRYADEIDRGRFDRLQWRGEPTFRHRKWSTGNQAWALFYEDVADLLTDVPTAEDPTNDGDGAFGRWALALYSGMKDGSA